MVHLTEARVEVAIGCEAAPAVLDDHHVPLCCPPGGMINSKGGRSRTLVIGASHEQYQVFCGGIRSVDVRAQHGPVPHLRLDIPFHRHQQAGYSFNRHRIPRCVAFRGHAAGNRI